MNFRKFHWTALQRLSRWHLRKIQEYPHCDLLIYKIATVLNASLTLSDLNDEERMEYNTAIIEWLERTADSQDERVRNSSVFILATKYVQMEKYEEAKQASIRDLGTTEDDEYTFYDVTFIADGVEIEVPDEAVVINMEFKNVASEENETQSALHIQETEAGVVAQDVTAQSADGTLKSVGFNF